MSSGNPIAIKIVSNYLASHSEPEAGRFVFEYHVAITNNGGIGARLLSRNWLITDADGHTQEVSGKGVVGMTPLILPNRTYRYSSCTMLTTPLGTMEGTYNMINDDGVYFTAKIPLLRLVSTEMVH